jgi:hypothetical protein
MPTESDKPKNSPAWFAWLPRLSPVRAFAAVPLAPDGSGEASPVGAGSFFACGKQPDLISIAA